MNAIPLSPKKHSELKIKPDPAYSQAKSQNLALLTAQEFALASKEYVIAFIKDEETGQFRPIALLGLTQKENLYYSESEWKANYIPLSLQTYPFGGHAQGNSEQTTICIYEEADVVNTQEGDALFNEDGSNSDFLTGKAQLVKHLLQNTWSTQHFVKFLTDNQLLKSQSLTINIEGQDPYDLNGLYVIDEKKLHELPDDQFIDLRKRGYLLPMYAALISQSNINQLAKFKVAKNKSEQTS